jgi:hypothetical protein
LIRSQPMDPYSVIPDNSTVPELTDLQLLYLDQPTGGGCGYVAFSFTPNISMLPLYEQAVGQRCRVLRTRWSDPGVRWGSQERHPDAPRVARRR